MQSRLQLLRSRKTKLCHVRNRLKCCLRLYLSERNNCWHLFFRRRTTAGKRFATKSSYSLSTACQRNWYPVSMQDDHQQHHTLQSASVHRCIAVGKPDFHRQFPADSYSRKRSCSGFSRHIPDSGSVLPPDESTSELFPCPAREKHRPANTPDH